MSETSHPVSRLHVQSLEDPDSFWGEAAQKIAWTRPFERVLDDRRPPFYRWFSGGQLNTCYNALDRHVEGGHGDRFALIYDSPITESVQRFTYAELLEAVSRFSGVLQNEGVGRGDRVLLYMPMVPEAVIGMLACARIGAVHSVVFGGFASQELATRIDDARPRIVLTASCGIEPNRVVEYMPLLEGALELADHEPSRCIVLQRERCPASLREGRDLDWQACMASAEPVPPVPVEATDPLYILYTSGTTGVPKGVVRDNGGHAVALYWSLENVYGMRPGDVFWAASDVGWVVGHSYIVYAPLLMGCTTLLYEGKPVGTPDAGAFWRVIADHGVNALFTAPTALRAIKREDPEAREPGRYDRGSLRTLFLAGERADPDTIAWAEEALGIPVVDHWWQTETGWPIVANCMGFEPLPIKRGSPTRPVPGYEVQILDDEGEPVAPGEADGASGHIAIRLPLPPGCLSTLWENEEGYRRSYLERFPGYYQTSDAGHIDADGYVYVMSRTDDIINVAGHRLSTGAMEEVLASHPDVAEAAVIGAKDALKGQIPIGLVVLKAGAAPEADRLESELVELVRDRIGPVAAMKTVLSVVALPKTRSGKVLRATMRKIADGETYRMPATIEDPAVLDQIAQSLAVRNS